MKRISVLLLLFLFFQCQNEQKNQLLPDGLEESTVREKELIAEIKQEPRFEHAIDLSTKIDMDSVRFQGVHFVDSKINLSAILGTPDSIIEPKYECGPFSEDWQQKKFYQYFYGHMNFIVYDSICEIQNIEFASDEELEFGNEKLDRNDSFENILKKLHISAPDTLYNTDRILIFDKEPIDEHYLLLFKDGFLHKFDRFEPC